MAEVKSTVRVADALRVAAMNVRHRCWLPTEALKRATGCEFGEGSHAAYTTVWYVFEEANSMTLARAEQQFTGPEIADMMEYAAQWPQANRVLPQ